ncbi:sulfotransferase [Candidatus Halobeggiatoa sp. HSG11]|nr:sulfotransferase [Candidatus Halobeggiatoa sp. HSG11]
MKIIYIISTGRSGSTILDILLGNGEDILSCGELNRYVIREGSPTYWRHKKGFPTQVFWENIKAKLETKFPIGLDMQKLNDIVSKYEYHSDFFKLSNNKKEFAIYSDFITKLNATIFENIEQSTIVDSSKYPARALKLDEILDCDIDFIYLQRDPRGVVKSFSKQGITQSSKSWLAANIYYLSVNLLCKFTVFKLKKNHKVIKIKYESLVGQPVETLKFIQRELQINLQPVIDKIQTDDFLIVGPLFEGNRMRMTDKVKLKQHVTHYPNTVKNIFTKIINFMV